MFLQGTNTHKAKEYVEVFFQAAENDPYLSEVVKEFDIPWVDNQHFHGWGYVLVTATQVFKYTCWDFVKDDESWKENLLSLLHTIQGEFMLMFELRVTDIGHVSAFNTHPFHFISRNGYEGYLFYNGLLDYEDLAKKEGIDFCWYETKNGTTLMGISIAKQLESGKTMKEAIEHPKVALQSAYNLMMYYRNNAGKYKALLHAYIREELRENPIIFRHNKVLRKREDDILFIGSSIVEHYAPWEYETLTNGETVEIDIDFIKEYYFDGYK